MRPAQKAPENNRCLRRRCRSCRGFNEAGAKSAGKRPQQERTGAQRHTSFNEAGAKSAGKLRCQVLNTLSHNAASMRPAQKAPENNPGSWPGIGPRSCFNEAGAKSAGKQPRVMARYRAAKLLQ